MDQVSQDQAFLAETEQRASWGLQELAQEFKSHPELLSGQKPHYAVVACADSRVKPDVLFDAHLGEAFLFRNIGNSMEDPSDPTHLSEQAEDYLTYANHLGIPTLVVMGHGACGCIANACNCAKLPPLPADADLKSRILRRMGDRKRYIVDMVSEDQGSLYLTQHDLPSEPDTVPARLKAVEVAHALHMAKLAKTFLASINSPMRVVVAHFNIATCSLYLSMDGDKFHNFVSSKTPANTQEAYSAAS